MGRNRTTECGLRTIKLRAQLKTCTIHSDQLSDCNNAWHVYIYIIIYPIYMWSRDWRRYIPSLYQVQQLQEKAGEIVSPFQRQASKPAAAQPATTRSCANWSPRAIPRHRGTGVSATNSETFARLSFERLVSLWCYINKGRRKHVHKLAFTLACRENREYVAPRKKKCTTTPLAANSGGIAQSSGGHAAIVCQFSFPS